MARNPLDSGGGVATPGSVDDDMVTVTGNGRRSWCATACQHEADDRDDDEKEHFHNCNFGLLRLPRRYISCVY